MSPSDRKRLIWFFGILIAVDALVVFGLVFVAPKILGTLGTSLEERRAEQLGIERQLGYTLGSPYVNGEEVWQFVAVEEGGFMHQQGLREGYILTMREGIFSSYERDILFHGFEGALLRHQGKPFHFTVYHPDVGKRRTISIDEVPDLQE